MSERQKNLIRTIAVKQRNGIWYITDIYTTGSVSGYAPVYLWTRIKRGFRVLAARVLIGWRRIKACNDAEKSGGQAL